MNESAYLRTLVAFARTVRQSGLPIGTDDVSAFCRAVSVLDPTDMLDLYWAGRTSLVTAGDQIEDYDRAFREFFLSDAGGEALDVEDPFVPQSRAELRSALEVPQTEPGEERSDEQASLGLAASEVAALRTKSLTACSPEELAALRQAMRSMRLTPPSRRSRRHVRSRRGHHPDLRRTVRETMRAHGEPRRLFRRERKRKVRPLVLLLDVSGSMADYSRALLQFAYSTQHGARSRVEVFVFGTRIARITGELDHRQADAALARATDVVVDWEGGTRIGACVDEFVRSWGRRGLARGGVVVVCSDGLDRGDPELLATSMERLGRLCHRIVWMNPHHRDGGAGRPLSMGMTAAADSIDLLMSGHDLRSLQELAEQLPRLR